jgi:purine-binding chemotaxis protein CheW
VDEIGDVVEVDEQTFEPPPDTVDRQAREFILGVHKLSGRLMHVLDSKKVVEVEKIN